MKTLGRNDPCPCGSGKKYKKCCQQSDESRDFTYRRQRNLEADLIERLRDYAFDLHSLATFEEAWHQFNDDHDVEMIPPDSPMLMLFMPWFLFHWRFEADEGTTNAISFLESPKVDLTKDEVRFLASAGTSQYSLCEVVHTKPGVGMRLRDLFTNEVKEIAERSASQTLHAGHIIYCAVMEQSGVHSNLATGPYELRPTVKREVLELRKELLKAVRKRKFTKGMLVIFESDIRNLYLNKVDELLAPPTMTNTDGDEMVFHKIYYQLASAAEAFERLKDLAQGYSDADLLRDAKLKRGRVVSAEIPWTGGTERARKQHGGSILLGLIKISERQLVVEVNSIERAEAIRKIIEERLVGVATYKRTLIEALQNAVDEMWESALKDAEDGRLDGGKTKPPLDPDDPEVRQILEQAAKDHWSTWYDIPVPALDNMTPREAALTPEGRDLLESLLLEYEIETSRNPDNNASPDIAALRRELEMD